MCDVISVVQIQIKCYIINTSLTLWLIHTLLTTHAHAEAPTTSVNHKQLKPHTRINKDRH